MMQHVKKSFQNLTVTFVLPITLAIASGLLPSPVMAQIVPDTSLPNNSSVAVESNVSTITGGTLVGRNLFHSFDQFSVLTNGTAYFDNSQTVQNIISRVTGKSVSNIDGLIKANGSANLFLLNPKGITFGPNSSLNIGGSFLTTTANALQFGDLGSFSASTPNNPALLTINPSALLFNQIAVAPIENQSRASINNQSVGLRVLEGQNLLLVGGNISMNGGRLTAPGGRVELASVAGSGNVGLNQTGKEWQLVLPDDLARADVSLRNRARILVAGADRGSITIHSRFLDIVGDTARSVLIAGIAPGLGTEDSKAGDITLNATERIRISTDAPSGSTTEITVVENRVSQQPDRNGRLTTGKAGNIQINTKSLLIDNNARLSASTFGKGNAGNVIINANSITLTGRKTAISSNVHTQATGNAGLIAITAGSLFMSGGTELLVYTDGQGNAGNVSINADTVTLSGTAGSNEFSGAKSRVNATANGKGGAIEIKARSVRLEKGGGLSSSTYGHGDAGNVIINADTVTITGPDSFVSSDVRDQAQGKGGEISINTRALSISDGAIIKAYTEANGKGGEINIATTGSFSLTDGAQLISTTIGQRDAGTVSIVSPNLTIRNKAQIEVSSAAAREAGNAGDVSIRTETLTLDNHALIKGETAQRGRGGNVAIDLSRLLLLRHKSQISTSAGTAQTTVNGETINGETGGDILIQAPLIVAVPGEDSDIAANAFSGTGGRVMINASGIFGIVPRSRADLERLLNTTNPKDLDPQKLPTSDVTAISQSNPSLNGTVTLNTLDADPSRGLVALPTTIVDTSQLIRQQCSANRTRNDPSQFVMTGRGGLPPAPGEPLKSSSVLSPWVTLPTDFARRSDATLALTPTPAPEEIVEAQGWVKDENGAVRLVAQVPSMGATGNSEGTPLSSEVACHGF